MIKHIKLSDKTENMNELQIVGLEEDVTKWDFAKLKEELKKSLSIYETTIYMDDNIKAAKKDRAELNKIKDTIENRRKTYKKEYMKSYNALEAQVKELTEIIDNYESEIKKVIDDYTNREKHEKEAEVKAYYKKKAFPLGKYGDADYNKIFDSKWLNASTSKKKYEEEILYAINNAVSDMSKIKSWNSKFENKLLDKYFSEGKSLEEVKELNAELSSYIGAEAKSENKNDNTAENERVYSDDISICVKATGTQLKQICDFMMAIGVEYEIK